jgi:hypothetical protein
MKAILSIIFAALIVNACVRAGDSAWRNYQLEDAIEQEARYGESKTTSDLRRRIIRLAADHDIPLADDDVTVERRGLETYVSVAYEEPIALIPRAYTYVQSYDITMSVAPLRPIVVDDKRK